MDVKTGNIRLLGEDDTLREDEVELSEEWLNKLVNIIPEMRLEHLDEIQKDRLHKSLQELRGCVEDTKTEDEQSPES